MFISQSCWHVGELSPYPAVSCCTRAKFQVAFHHPLWNQILYHSSTATEYVANMFFVRLFQNKCFFLRMFVFRNIAYMHQVLPPVLNIPFCCVRKASPTFPRCLFVCGASQNARHWSANGAGRFFFLNGLDTSRYINSTFAEGKGGMRKSRVRLVISDCTLTPGFEELKYAEELISALQYEGFLHDWREP